MSEARRVTLREVAEAAGVSIGTVSYALRGATCIPAETTSRVREVAERLGYRANARVAELMAHIRRGRSPGEGEPMALVYLEGGRVAAKRRGFAQGVELAARRHAAERGYRLDTFWLTEVAGNARRLAGILSTRGIKGVLFAPMVGTERMELNWPWEEFAVAVIGMSELNRAVPRAGHHHYEGMREAVERLTAAGARRPVAIVDAATNQRAHRGWQAAWLAFGPKDAARRLWLRTGHDSSELAAWLAQRTPDAIIADDAGVLRTAASAVPSAHHCAVLSWHPTCGFSGIDQGYDSIAAHAVDLVVTQLQRNEPGIPCPPPMVLFPGRWRD